MNRSAYTIVYDWNGTLLDDVEASLFCVNVIMGKLGLLPVSVDTYRTHYDIPIERLYDGLGFPRDQFDIIPPIFHDTYEPLAAKSSLRHGCADLLQQARDKGVRQIILSNHIIAPIQFQLERLAISPLIDEVLANTSRESQFTDGTKGEKLDRYLKEHHLSPSRTIILGDSPEEMLIARDLGLISIALTGGCVSEPRLREARPDYLIHALSDLPPILQERGFFS